MSAVLSVLARHAAAQRPSQSVGPGGALNIASADSDPSSIRSVTDLAAALRDALPRVLPVVGRGPVQNVEGLLDQDMAAALVSSDVVPYLGRTGRFPEAAQSLQYIAMLYREDVHILALANVASVADLAGRPVNIGLPDSRSSITASTIFDTLGIRVQPVFLEQTAALQALQQRQITALVQVARKPASLFFSLNQGDGVHFLPLPQKQDLARIYLPSRLSIADYPLLIGQGEAGRGPPIPAVAVATVIAVANPASGTERYRNLARLTDVLFLFAAAAPKGAPDSIWSDFNPILNVPGWRRFAPAAMWLQGKTAVEGEGLAQPTTPRSGARFNQPQRDQNEVNRRQEREKLFQEYLRWMREQEHQ